MTTKVQEEQEKQRLAIDALIGGGGWLTAIEGYQFVTIRCCYDNSDIMSDYYAGHHQVGDCYVIALVRGTRRSEATARRVIEQIPEIATLNWTWHRENYSMGHGYWLESEPVGNLGGVTTYGGQENPPFWYEIKFDPYSDDLQASRWFK